MFQGLDNKSLAVHAALLLLKDQAAEIRDIEKQIEELRSLGF